MMRIPVGFGISFPNARGDSASPFLQIAFRGKEEAATPTAEQSLVPLNRASPAPYSAACAWAAWWLRIALAPAAIDLTML